MKPHERLQALVEAAKEVARPDSKAGQQARQRWVSGLDLSPEAIEFAVQRCLETRPSEEELGRLLTSVPQAAEAWVLLSANVFTSAHRALALALASSERVLVRPSRRDPVLLDVLHQLLPGLFEVRESVEPKPGAVVFAYGRRETLRTVESQLPSGVTFLGHGPGAGAAVLDLDQVAMDEVERKARGLAEDTVLFEQRGCLSPRVILVKGPASTAIAFCRAVSRQLEVMGAEVPRAALGSDEIEEIARFRQTLGYVGELFEGEHSVVGLSRCSTVASLSPVGRTLHIQHVPDPILPLSRVRHLITTVGCFGPPQLKAKLQSELPHARITEVGQMQAPPFDGPVDRRPPWPGVSS